MVQLETSFHVYLLVFELQFPNLPNPLTKIYREDLVSHSESMNLLDIYLQSLDIVLVYLLSKTISTSWIPSEEPEPTNGTNKMSFSASMSVLAVQVSACDIHIHSPHDDIANAYFSNSENKYSA